MDIPREYPTQPHSYRRRTRLLVLTKSHIQNRADSTRGRPLSFESHSELACHLVDSLRIKLASLIIWKLRSGVLLDVKQDELQVKSCQF